MAWNRIEALECKPRFKGHVCKYENVAGEAKNYDVWLN